ncbi:nucleotide-binding universal stress UspA family protein [Lewinella marina]|nr:universal stress protein [Neolewinella marina]NJB87192.1 nucleotide-binding universal stress UspA family protein [Neolewinella marina]
MKTITSILVPTDFSDVALSAFTYALQLADALDASIDLMHAIPPTTDNPGYDIFINHLTTDLQEEARHCLSKFFARGIGQVNQQLSRVPQVENHVMVGDLRLCIRQHIEDHGNQLIVMGTAGRRNAWDDFLGTNASYLVNRAPCPVLVIPPGATYREIKSICFATDLHDVGTFQAGKLLRALRPFQPDLHFLHVRQAGQQEAAEYDLDLLREVFDRPEAGLKASFNDLPAEDLVEAVFSFAQEKECELVVMHRPDRTWLRRLLLKSNTSEAVRRARLPLLIITAEDLVATDQPAQGQPVRELNP